jgi:hypothetical protein
VSLRLRALIAIVVAASVLALGVSYVWFPLGPSIGGPLGLAFWTVATLVASAFPVRLHRGSILYVFTTPIIAALVLGGPLAGGLVALVGTTELRELKGEVPWYGTLYNHASAAFPAVLGGIVYLATMSAESSQPFSATPYSFLAAVLSGTVFFAANTGLTVATISIRDRTPARSVLAGDFGTTAASWLSLPPLGWLMATVWLSLGWASLLFALPLYTTRAAYRQVVELRRMFTQTVRALATAIDARDPYTKRHSDKVQQISLDVGRLMHCSEAELEALEWGALLHDIGKIGIGDSVLLKPDKLNRDERILMNHHPAMGEEIIRPVDRLRAELPLIRHHHEWYNGSGYPDHLVGEEIPKLARIIHVADAWEAMTAARPYRMTPLKPEEALAELRKYAGIQFDPAVVEAFARTDWAAGVTDGSSSPPRPKPVPLFRRAAALAARGGGGNGQGREAG